MEVDLKQRIDKYVTDKYTVEQQKIQTASQDKMSELPQLGKGNSAYSVYLDERHIRLFSERVNALALAMGNIMIDAYEIYGAPLDNQIVEEVRKVRDCAVGAISSGCANQMKMEVGWHRRHVGQGDAITASFRRQLTGQTQYVDREVACLIEERKVIPKHRRNETIGLINMNGPNQRVVFGTDQSLNKVVINEQNFFTQVRETLNSQVAADKQSEILARLEAVEAAADTPALAARWSEFRAAAADYWSFIAPYIPLIQEFLHRHGVIS